MYNYPSASHNGTVYLQTQRHPAAVFRTYLVSSKSRLVVLRNNEFFGLIYIFSPRFSGRGAGGQLRVFFLFYHTVFQDLVPK